MATGVDRDAGGDTKSVFEAGNMEDVVFEDFDVAVHAGSKSARAYLLDDVSGALVENDDGVVESTGERWKLESGRGSGRGFIYSFMEAHREISHFLSKSFNPGLNAIFVLKFMQEVEGGLQLLGFEFRRSLLLEAVLEFGLSLISSLLGLSGGQIGIAICHFPDIVFFSGHMQCEME